MKMSDSFLKIDKDTSNLYLFYGDEDYKKRLYKDRLKSCYSSAGMGGMNCSYFDGEGADMAAVYDICMSVPFFSDKRLVIIENTGLFKSKNSSKKSQNQDSGSEASDAEASPAKAANAENEGGSKNAEILEKTIAELPETTCLAIFEDNVAKNKRLYKLIAKSGIVNECGKDGRFECAQWLSKGFKQAGKSISSGVVNLILDKCGTDYTRLRQEFEKILNYSADSREITRDAVDAVVSFEPESKIYAMLGAITEKNTSAALDRYLELIYNKAHPLYILSMLRLQIRSLLETAELLKKNEPEQEIKKKLGFQGNREFLLDKNSQYLRHVNQETLIKYLDDICETDMRIKSGKISEQIGVELLITSFLNQNSAK